MYAQLLIDLFKFLAPFLRNAELAKPVTLLYKGTLRVLLVLLHDFPEFLCDYHYGFCDVIPPNCIQVTEQTKSLICAFLGTFLIKSSNGLSLIRLQPFGCGLCVQFHLFTCM